MIREKSSNQPRGRWPGYARLSMLQIVVSILTIALFCSSCASSRKESNQTGALAAQAYADSLISELRRQETVTVPQSSVVLKLPIDDLRRLPSGAEFRDKSGQASVSVQFDQGTVCVSATCDSLQRMCSYYESKYSLYKTEYENLMAWQESELEEDPPDVIHIFFRGVLLGVLSTIAIIIFIKLKTKRL